jgi:glycosyltransferase involved in cell wall biosynthesis
MKRILDLPSVKNRIPPPLITVITVVYNGAKTLESTIHSVIDQANLNIEYIVIDGGSTDGSLDIIRKFDHGIDYWVSEPDEGIYDAWNKGIRLASGEWIAFIGADDCYVEGALAEYIKLANECHNHQVDYISSRVNLTKAGRVIRTIGQQWCWKVFQRYMNVAHVGSLHNRRIFETYGYYDVSYSICGDYELLLRPREKLKALFMDFETVNMSIGGASDGAQALCEMERAKIMTGGRSPILSRMERIVALVKYRLRKWVWY